MPLHLQQHGSSSISTENFRQLFVDILQRKDLHFYTAMLILKKYNYLHFIIDKRLDFKLESCALHAVIVTKPHCLPVVHFVVLSGPQTTQHQMLGQLMNGEFERT